MIVTPKDILASVLEGETKPLSLKPWENQTQCVLFSVSAGALILGFLCAAATHIWPEKWLGYTSLISLVIAMAGSAIYQLAVVFPMLKMLRHSEQSLSTPATERFNNDIDRISSLARDFEKHHLEYARDRLSLIADQLRNRISFLVGAIEKVGILPLAVTGYLSAEKVLADPKLASSGIEWAFGALIALYLMAIHLLVVSQQLDRLVLIVRHAANKKCSERILLDEM